MLLIIDNQFGINQNTNSVLVNKIFDFKACNCAEKIRGVDGNTPYFLTAIVADHVTSLNSLIRTIVDMKVFSIVVVFTA